MLEVGWGGGKLLQEGDDGFFGPGSLREVVEGEEEVEVECRGGFEGEVEGGVGRGVLGGNVEDEGVDFGGLGEADVVLPVGEGEGGEVADLGRWLSEEGFCGNGVG